MIHIKTSNCKGMTNVRLERKHETQHRGVRVVYNCRRSHWEPFQNVRHLSLNCVVLNCIHANLSDMCLWPCEGTSHSPATNKHTVRMRWYLSVSQHFCVFSFLHKITAALIQRAFVRDVNNPAIYNPIATILSFHFPSRPGIWHFCHSCYILPYNGSYSAT